MQKMQSKAFITPERMLRPLETTRGLEPTTKSSKDPCNAGHGAETF